MAIGYLITILVLGALLLSGSGLVLGGLALGIAGWLLFDLLGIALSLGTALGILFLAALLPLGALLVGEILDRITTESVETRLLSVPATILCAVLLLQSSGFYRGLEAMLQFSAGQPSTTLMITLCAAALNAVFLCAGLVAISMQGMILLLELPIRWSVGTQRRDSGLQLRAIRLLLVMLLLSFSLNLITDLLADKLAAQNIIRKISDGTH